MNAIVVSEFGGPDVLKYTNVDTPEPARDDALVRIKAIGVNYVDVYHRTGLYKQPLSFTPGSEAAGVVEKIGASVSGLSIGDRVAWAMSMGSYAEAAVVPAWRLVPMPDHLEFTGAAAAMLQGMTAHYLVTSTYPLKAGDTALIHAAAGGTGLLLIQMAKMIGARVIGTVSNPDKANLAREAGADEIINYIEHDFEHEVQRITSGAGVNVVYDSVGKTTFERSLKSLKPRGLLASFGQSSGPVPAFNPALLAQGGSLFLTRPSLAHYTANREELMWRAEDVLGWIRDGKLKLRIDSTFPLAAAAEAHRALEGRKTSGKVLLIP